jgi:hypothetical protein
LPSEQGRNSPGQRPEPSWLTDGLPLLIECAGGCRTAQPLTAGIPVPKGSLNDPVTLCLLDAGGRPVPSQTEVLARWPDGSVKWLLLDFVAPSLSGGCERWLLRGRPERTGPGPAERLRILDSTAGVVVETGAVAVHLSPAALPFARVLTGGEDLLEPASVRTVLTDAKGRSGSPRVERVVVEDRGPVRATVRLEGRFGGRIPARFVARLCFFAGTALVRLRLTLHNPKRARHRGGLWDLGDSGSMFFRELAVEMALRGPDQARLTWAAEIGHPPQSLEAGRLEVYQDSSGGANWQSKNHVNRHGRVPCSFRGYRVRAGGREAFGLRASPQVALRGANGGVAVAVQEFWQQFPKALEAEDKRLRVGLFPGQWDDLFELQGGEQKTHTVWFDFTPAGLDWVHRPARVCATPAWYADTGAVPFLTPDPRPGASAELDSLLAESLNGANSLFARREVIDEYGWRNFGDFYADHEAAYCPDPPPVVSHYNNQYDVIYGTLLQYLRTGDGRWFELADPLARHVLDIDIYRTTRDRALYSGGLFWHTEHYRDAATGTHRGFSAAKARPGQPSGGGPCDEHNYTTGLLHYYYLTGEKAARDAVLGLADWVLVMDDGRNNILGVLDDGPTGLASRTRRDDFHGPGRGCGNSVNALLDAWLLGGSRTYLDKAEELIRRSIHPADDVAARDLLNAEERWSYTVFLTALARYLDLKAQAGEVDFMYAYGRASLLHYAAWMREHERPYFDRPEQLEYPTETWAAQELRKANVLRLAAAHADEPLRAGLLRRWDELAERAWRDLFGFASRTVARALALVMTEGTREAFFRSSEVSPAPRPAAVFDFGAPEVFVPQRRRVLARLKTPWGFLGALLRLADVRNWRKVLWR